MIAKAQPKDRNILNYLHIPALLEVALICFRKAYALFYIKKPFASKFLLIGIGSLSAVSSA